MRMSSSPTCDMDADRDTRTAVTVYDWAKAASFLGSLEESAELEDVEERCTRPKLVKAPSLATIHEER